MRHIEQITIGKLSYHVPGHVVQEVEDLLKKAKIKALRNFDDEDSIPAHILFPEIDDSVKGPAIALRGMRRRSKMTQLQLAKKVGIKQSHLSEMECGKRPIGKAMAKRLASVLGANWKSFL